MLRTMVIRGERIAEEEFEDNDGTDNVSDTTSIGDIGESPDITSLVHYQLILLVLVYHHHHLSVVALMGKLKRLRRIAKLFIKVMEYCIFQEI